MVVSGVNFVFVKNHKFLVVLFLKTSIIGISSVKDSCLYGFRKYDAH